MNIHLDIDTSKGLSPLDIAILNAIAGNAGDKAVSIPPPASSAAAAPAGPRLVTPAPVMPLPPSEADIARAALAKGNTGPVLVVEAKPSLTASLVPTQAVPAPPAETPAASTPAAPPAAPATPAAAEPPAAPATPSADQPTMDQMREAVTAFVSHPNCGGPAAMGGILKRYGNATGLTGTAAVPTEMWAALHAELTKLVRLAQAPSSAAA